MNPPLDNRELIIRAAESMFALQGVHAASLRAINSAAEQRNNAALHYHFRTRTNLIEAVLSEHAGTISEARARRAGAHPGSEKRRTVEAYLDTLVGPLAELLEEAPRGPYFLMIAHQLVDDPRTYPHPVPGRGDFGNEPELIAGLVDALDNLPPHLARLRVHQALLHASHALAQRAQRIVEHAGDEAASELQLSNAAFVANMIDMLMGGLLAPASRAALDHLGLSLSD
jgi:AcrR family transcriptional regulator